MKENCDLCLRNTSASIMENDSFYVLKGDMSVSFGHLVIVSKRHVSSYYDLKPNELTDMHSILRNAKSYTDKMIQPDGYNIGINIGEWSGQDMKHVAVHLIPRFAGDVPATNLKGGIKNFLKKEIKERAK